jgi:TetR/AcrR family transcriptional repressor of nem operon
VKNELTGFLKAVVNDVFSDTSPKGCFKVNSEVELTLHDELIRKMIAEDDLLIEEALYKAIATVQDTGEISRSKNAKALARFICNTITGMRVYSKFRSDRQFFDDIVDTTCRRSTSNAP